MIKFNFYLGATVSAWLLVILIVIAEFIVQFKTFLASTFGHHWIGKAVIVTFAFLAFGFLLKNRNSIGDLSDDKLAWYSVLGSLIVIFLFFAVEFLK